MPAPGLCISSARAAWSATESGSAASASKKRCTNIWYTAGRRGARATMSRGPSPSPGSPSRAPPAPCRGRAWPRAGARPGCSGRSSASRGSTPGPSRTRWPRAPRGAIEARRAGSTSPAVAAAARIVLAQAAAPQVDVGRSPAAPPSGPECGAAGRSPWPSRSATLPRRPAPSSRKGASAFTYPPVSGPSRFFANHCSRSAVSAFRDDAEALQEERAPPSSSAESVCDFSSRSAKASATTPAPWSNGSSVADRANAPRPPCSGSARSLPLLPSIPGSGRPVRTPLLCTHGKGSSVFRASRPLLRGLPAQPRSHPPASRVPLLPLPLVTTLPLASSASSSPCSATSASPPSASSASSSLCLASPVASSSPVVALVVALVVAPPSSGRRILVAVFRGEALRLVVLDVLVAVVGVVFVSPPTGTPDGRAATGRREPRRPRMGLRDLADQGGVVQAPLGDVAARLPAQAAERVGVRCAPRAQRPGRPRSRRGCPPRVRRSRRLQRRGVRPSRSPKPWFSMYLPDTRRTALRGCPSSPASTCAPALPPSASGCGRCAGAPARRARRHRHLDDDASLKSTELSPLVMRITAPSGAWLNRSMHAARSWRLCMAPVTTSVASMAQAAARRAAARWTHAVAKMTTWSRCARWCRTMPSIAPVCGAARAGSPGARRRSRVPAPPPASAGTAQKKMAALCVHRATRVARGCCTARCRWPADAVLSHQARRQAHLTQAELATSWNFSAGTVWHSSSVERAERARAQCLHGEHVRRVPVRVLAGEDGLQHLVRRDGDRRGRHQSRHVSG